MGVPHLRHARIPISARLNIGSERVDGMTRRRVEPEVQQSRPPQLPMPSGIKVIMRSLDEIYWSKLLTQKKIAWLLRHDTTVLWRSGKNRQVEHKVHVFRTVAHDRKPAMELPHHA